MERTSIPNHQLKIKSTKIFGGYYGLFPATFFIFLSSCFLLSPHGYMAIMASMLMCFGALRTNSINRPCHVWYCYLQLQGRSNGWCFIDPKCAQFILCFMFPSTSRCRSRLAIQIILQKKTTTKKASVHQFLCGPLVIKLKIISGRTKCWGNLSKPLIRCIRIRFDLILKNKIN
jgi:hypothetical protein